ESRSGKIDHAMLQPNTKDPAKTSYTKQDQGPPEPSSQNRKSRYRGHPQSSDDLSKRGQYSRVRLDPDDMRSGFCNDSRFSRAKDNCAQQGSKETSAKQ